MPLPGEAIETAAAGPADGQRYLSLVAAATDQLMAADDPGAMIDSLFALIRKDLRLDVFFHFRRDGDAVRLETSGGLTPAERQARLAAGQAASKSLSGAGGGPAGEITLEMLATMSEADFEKFAAKNPGKLEALMGA